MNKPKLFPTLLTVILSVIIISCGPSMKTTGKWVNKDKIPAEPVKSVFIIAFTDNIESRAYLENALAEAAVQKGLKAYRSVDVVGPVEMKYIAPVKDVFIKKLQGLNCQTIFTVALVDATSETKYVGSATVVYSPYPYGPYNGTGGYSANSAYGFGGYYNYAVSTMSSAAYYKTEKKYFLEAKMFDLDTEELLFSIQTTAENPEAIEKSSKTYTKSLMDEIKKMNLQKK